MHNFLHILAGLLVFAVIVFIHELGHYLAARWRKIDVDVFSIGFGPSLFSWHDRVGTRWQLSLLPLGGYVKLHGFDRTADSVSEQAKSLQADEGYGEEAQRKIALSYHDQPLFSRVMVTIMGPVFNIILTLILFVFLFSFYGQPRLSTDVSMVVTQSAAEQAGLQKGDHLTLLDGHKILTIPDFQQQIAARPNKDVLLGIVRHGQEMTLNVHLQSVKENGKEFGRLGVGFSQSISQPLPFYKAIPAAFGQTWDMTTMIFSGIWQIISGQRSADQLTGTLGIIHMSGEVAASGFVSLLSFVAMLSLNLGLVNLLPIPVLDGGHLFFYAIEALRGGRPVPEKIQNYALQIGVIFIGIIFLGSLYNDTHRLGLFTWLGSKL